MSTTNEAPSLSVATNGISYLSISSGRRKLPSSVRTVLDLFQNHQFLKISDIIDITGLTPKTARFAVNRLVKLEIIYRIPDLTDLRTYLYSLKN